MLKEGHILYRLEREKEIYLKDNEGILVIWQNKNEDWN